jgi:hypothetical protein
MESVPSELGDGLTPDRVVSRRAIWPACLSGGGQPAAASRASARLLACDWLAERAGVRAGSSADPRGRAHAGEAGGLRQVAGRGAAGGPGVALGSAADMATDAGCVFVFAEHDPGGFARWAISGQLPCRLAAKHNHRRCSSGADQITSSLSSRASRTFTPPAATMKPAISGQPLAAAQAGSDAACTWRVLSGSGSGMGATESWHPRSYAVRHGDRATSQCL